MQINTWLLRIFVLLWGVFIWLDYSYHSSYYAQALSNFPQWGFLFVLLLFPLGYALLRKKNNQWNSQFALKPIPGWHWLALGLLVQILSVAILASQNGLLAQDAVPKLGYFLFFSLGQVLILSLIVMTAYVLGRPLVMTFSTKGSRAGQTLVALAVGFCVLTLILFLLGAIGALTTYVVGFICLIILGLGWKQVLDLGRYSLFEKEKAFKIHPLFLLVGMVLLVFISMNLVSMARPMPLGFDAMNLYANKPNLLAQYGALTHGGQAYNWSLIMSLGFVLFDSTALGLLLSILPGILSVFVVYRIARMITGRGWALLAATLYYTIPIVTWQSTQEAKVDLALLFILLAAMLFWLEHKYGSEIKQANKPVLPLLGRVRVWAQSNREAAFWVLTGLLMGYAMGIKYTTVFAIVAFMVMALRDRLGSWGFWAAYLGGFAFLFGLGVQRFSSMEINWPTAGSITVVSLILGTSLLVIGWMRQGKPTLGGTFKSWGVLLGISLLVFAPWVVKNVSEADQLSIRSVLEGKGTLPRIYDVDFDNPETSWEDQIPQPVIPTQKALYTQASPEEDLGEQTESSQEDTTQGIRRGVYEEMARYVGYERGIMRMISLPYDMGMRTNVNNYAVDLSFLFLLFLPLLMLVPKPRQLVWNVVRIVVLLAWLGASYYSAWYMDGVAANGLQGTIEQTVSEQQPFLMGGLEAIYQPLASLFYSIGDGLSFLLEHRMLRYNYLPHIIGVFSAIVLFFLYRGYLKTLGRREKSLIAFSVVFGMIWFVFGSGIAWYGLVALALIGVFMASGFNSEGRIFGDRFNRYVGYTFIGIWLFSALILRLTHTNPLENPTYRYYDPLFTQYRLGEFSAEETVNKQIDLYLPALRVINRNTDGMVLRAGTFINYFIRENDRRVYVDNQLNLFAYLLSMGTTKEEVAEKMRQANIQYIVYALNTGANDATPNKTVQKKAQLFYEFVFNNPRVQLIHTDRLVADPNGQEMTRVNGQPVRVSRQIFGATQNVVQPGSYAAFEIL